MKGTEGEKGWRRVSRTRGSSAATPKMSSPTLHPTPYTLRTLSATILRTLCYHPTHSPLPSYAHPRWGRVSRTRGSSAATPRMSSPTLHPKP
eukprot:3177878-Rhodomonas_salina.1